MTKKTESLKLEIFKIGINDMTETVEKLLRSKQEFINKEFKSFDSGDSLDKLIEDQKIIDAVKSLIMIYRDTTDQLRSELEESRRVQLTLRKTNALLHKDSNDYMDKYYDLMLKK